MTPADIIKAFKMMAHPEGGYYAETFRDSCQVDGRAMSSAIYYLLERGQCSHWHRVDATEVWHWYAGAPLSLRIHHDGETQDYILGPDVLAGQSPQIVVPFMAWQSAEAVGDWTLSGCTVAPGFQFEGFEMAPPGWEP